VDDLETPEQPQVRRRYRSAKSADQNCNLTEAITKKSSWSEAALVVMAASKTPPLDWKTCGYPVLLTSSLALYLQSDFSGRLGDNAGSPTITGIEGHG
jgi:hypothetical protein